MIKTRRTGPADEILRVDLTEFTGRYFYTTDLHGHYDLLHEKLREVAFDSTKDVLFLGADMCDRGPDSQYVLDYLCEPWVYCIRGNHEQMLIEAVECEFKGPEARLLYENGGEWLFDLHDQGKHSEIKAIYDMFKSLPLAMELILPTERIGIVHAEVPHNDWDKFRDEYVPQFEEKAQWGRTKYMYSQDEPVRGVDVVLSGHTATKSGNLELLGNQVYCDLGSFFRNKICFIEISDEFIKGVKNGKI